jgi:hypothetical protein
MSDYPVTLNVPDHIYNHARQIAENSDEAVEAILIRHLETAFSQRIPALPPEEQNELDALTHLSDDALWTIAREQMAARKQARMQTLMDANSNGSITDEEHQELAQLVEQGQRLMLRKAQAAALLTERGFQVKPTDMSPEDE